MKQFKTSIKWIALAASWAMIIIWSFYPEKLEFLILTCTFGILGVLAKISDDIDGLTNKQ